MTEHADLLIELGTEELPAGSVQPMSVFLGNELKKLLDDAGLAPGELQVYATPRRLAALIAQVPAKQADRKVQKRGPAVAAAFDDEGNPSKALAGFARSCGAEINQLTKLETEKGAWMVFDTLQPGQSLLDIVSKGLAQILKQMPMPRRMRWSDQKHEFLRPVQWLVVMHGNDVLPVSVLGLTAGRETAGHRFHAPGPFSLATAKDYVSTLKNQAFVLADFSERRALIRKQVIELSESIGGRVNIDQGLLDEVTALVEWPMAIYGQFEEAFLRIPKEALIQTMEENQRYFALFDSNDALMPGFITIANLESTRPASVREGNERVIRPRFKDTMFFWDNDLKRKLLSLREGLQKVLFQEKLGSVYDKCVRLEAMCNFIAPAAGADLSECQLAAQLCKCDLRTDIVNELPKMQGIAGRYYAQLEGYAESISEAMEQQYYPKQAGGVIPQGSVSRTLAIADKVDTLTGIFGVGLKPTGARDPFALRRASLGLLRILIEGEIDLDLAALVDQSVQTFSVPLVEDFSPQEVVAYITERLKGYYQEQGESGDVLDAVLATGVSNPFDIDRRVKAVSTFRKTTDAAALSAANKRIQNILKKTQGDVAGTVQESLLQEPAEQRLAEQLSKVGAQIEAHYSAASYNQAMALTATLRESVDGFFDGVMVMSDDQSLRENRLALLKQVGDLCSRTADLSRLQPESSP